MADFLLGVNRILSNVAGASFLIGVLSLPFLVAQRTRGGAGNVMLLASYPLGLHCFFLSGVVAYAIWGGIAVWIGIFLLGVGVLPVALAACAWAGQWDGMLLLLLVFGATMGFRIGGMAAIESTAR